MLPEPYAFTALPLPRVENLHPRLIEIAPVACYNSKPVVQGCRRQHEVGMRIGVPDPASLFHQQPPLQQDVFRYRQNPPRECRLQCQLQPFIQIGAARRVFLKNIGVQ